MWAERSTFRMPTNQISKTSLGRAIWGCAVSYFAARPGAQIRPLRRAPRPIRAGAKSAFRDDSCRITMDGKSSG
jgi:hypothetical protein